MPDRKTMPDRPLDPARAACWLLIWQEPTDRALTGWCAEPGFTVMRERWSEESLTSWLREQVEDTYL